MPTALVFKNLDIEAYKVFQCPNCRKVLFTRYKGDIFCCECTVKLEPLTIQTSKVELEI